MSDIFSKRRKKERGEFPDVYQYENIPNKLRVQIIYILDDALARRDKIYEIVHTVLTREYGVFQLTNYQKSHLYEEVTYEKVVQHFILNEPNAEKILDSVELLFKIINLDGSPEAIASQPLWLEKEVKSTLINELNQRFRENGVGYQFESKEIIRVDSQLMHSEAVRPVLNLLADPIFSGANDEFLKAHEHYRHARYQECLIECLKAFESVMKIICNQRGWKPKSGASATARELVSTCLQNKLIPDYLQTQFSSLENLLVSGVPTLRNKNGGHGQGDSDVSVPGYFAQYSLHMTASTILFLIETYKATY